MKPDRRKCVFVAAIGRRGELALNFGCTHSNTAVVLLSVAGGGKLAADILFYVNLGMAILAFILITVLTVLHRKTACMRTLAASCIGVFCVGIVLFGVQLGMYAAGHASAAYAVYICAAVLYCAFIVGGVYFAMLSRNSHRALCIATGITCLVPPIGTVMCILLSYRIKRDTAVKKFVYSGYAYTYAALGSFSERNKAMLDDLGGEEECESPLDKKQLNKKLKSLKKDAKTAVGKYNYAVALVNFVPYKFAKALRLMQKAADEQYTPALFNIGYYYEMGEYLKRDYKKARAYYARDAANGDGDAVLRTAIIDIKSGEGEVGLKKLEELADGGNLRAKYNLGVCREIGCGTAVDLEQAFAIYAECANAGMFGAQKRIFAAACTDMQSAQNGRLFRMITDRKFESEEFAAVIDGLIDIKRHLAADASENFLRAITSHGRWEGVARCLVGTLYLDCGKLPEDKRNGAEYIKSAFPLWDGAKEIYAALPRNVE